MIKDQSKIISRKAAKNAKRSKSLYSRKLVFLKAFNQNGFFYFCRLVVQSFAYFASLRDKEPFAFPSGQFYASVP
jgi:hypothetical protein